MVAFGIGKRRCIGTNLAREEYFQFATKLIHAFKIHSVDKTINFSQVGTLLAADTLRIQFIQR
jgi:cytochrome P450